MSKDRNTLPDLKGIGRDINAQNMAALKQAWNILGEVIRRSESGLQEEEEMRQKKSDAEREAEAKKNLDSIKAEIRRKKWAR